MATVTIELNKLPYQKSYVIKQGDGLEDAFHFKIKSEAATTYSDLTLVGSTLLLYVSKGGVAVISGTKIIPDTASQGKFRVRVAGATTATWTDEYTYAVQCTFPVRHTNFPDGCVKTLLEGRIKIRLDL